MKIITDKYFSEYKKLLKHDVSELLDTFEKDTGIDLDYAVNTSAVFSSNIEGNPIDLNSFMNYKMTGKRSKSKKEIAEIEELIEAYEFAMENELTEENFLKAHEILGRSILIKSKRGKYRDDKIGVFDESGLVYLAVEADLVNEKMNELFKDIKELIEMELSIEKILYFASLIHLKFVHIHPFTDGNGRAARLLEKWFLSEKINSRAWQINSEKYYKENISEYYSSINLGVNYHELDYDKCIPFLLMLVKAVFDQFQTK